MKSHPTIGNNFTTQANSVDICSIDYLTLVFDCEELDRKRAEAKLAFQADRSIHFQDHYKALLTPDEIVTTDKMLKTMLENFIFNLDVAMSKSYADLKHWREISGEEFDHSDNARWTITNNNFGRFKYAHSANLYFDDVQVGLLCWGSENFGAMISFTGKCCASIDFDAMYKLCKEMDCVRISRLDLAHDDYQGVYNVDTCRSMFKNGLFTVTTEPSYQYYESGILSEKGKLIPSGGRSFYVGKRTNGKMLRCYEKGKQMQSTESPNWCRWEVELRNVDRVIPLEALQNPSKFFGGTYPALERFTTEQEKVKLKCKKLTATYEHLLKHAVLGYGKLINYAVQVYDVSGDDLIKMFTSELKNIDDFPRRIKNDACVLTV